MSTYNESYFLNSARRRYQITDLLESELMSLRTGSRLIELGCGDMEILKAISRMRPDLKLYGADIGELPPDTRQIGVEFIQSDIKDLSLGPEFDFVLCVDVLEHLTSAQDLAKCMRRILADSGRFYISVPSVTNLLLFGDENFYSDYTHVRPFNNKSLGRLLHDNGLRAERIRPIDSKGKGNLNALRNLYYLSRGVITSDSGYINAAIRSIGGTTVESVGVKSLDAARQLTT
jgi:SAM-dependent methyltransferase